MPVTTNIATLDCCVCGVIFGIPTTMMENLKDSRQSFFCPNGHRQHFSGESKDEQIERLRKNLDNSKNYSNHLKDQLESTKRSKIAIKGALTRTKNRIAKGVCPFCNRHFENLQRHMEGKHANEPGAFTAE